VNHSSRKKTKKKRFVPQAKLIQDLRRKLSSLSGNKSQGGQLGTLLHSSQIISARRQLEAICQLNKDKKNKKQKTNKRCNRRTQGLSTQMPKEKRKK